MPATLSKNCIVGGELDWYCLACCALLSGAEDAVEHIQDAAHKRNLTDLPYVDKYKDDFIRKAHGVYYCEVCEVTLPTAAKVGLHVTEATHAAGRTGRQLKRAGTAIVFQQNTLITESAWNGLVDDTCVLCNAEFDDESTHKSQQSHILNLINSSVTAADNHVYRKIDGGYQCLTCNKVVHEDAITEHLNSAEHKNTFVNYNQSQNGVKDEKNDNVKDKESKDATSNTEFRKPDGKTLYTSPVLIKDKTKAACSSDVMEVKTLAKRHGLSVNKGSSNVHCSACSVHVTATCDRINEHVAGKKHKGNMEKQSQAKIQTLENIKKIPTNAFITNIMETRDTFTEQQFIVLNESIFLLRNTFIGLKIINNRLICLFCEIDLTEDNVTEHLRSLAHINILDNCFVIASLKGEFIREIRRDLYHCGYCATVENDFEDMMDHLDTAEHKKCKGDHFTKMEEFKTQRDAETMRANMLLNLLRLRATM